MSIGDNIKRLRREIGITQEQLAEYMGITSRAVSQWECGRTSPDISQIPVLCHIFGVSSDVILGIDVEKNDEEAGRYLEKAQNAGHTGDRAGRTEILREANGRFPRDYRIMLALADSLVCEYSRAGIKDYGEVFALCRRILDGCTDSNIRYEAIDTLAVAYDYAGKREEMLKLASEMPKSHFSYENFMLYRWKGDRAFDERQGYIFYLINQLIAVIGCAAGHCDDKGKAMYSNEEKIELYKLQVDLLERIFPDGDYQYMAQEGEIACTFISLCFIRNGDVEKAFEWLTKAVDFAIHMDTYGFDAPHTSLILRGYSDGGWIVEEEGNRSQSLLKWLTTDSKAAPLRVDPRFEGLLARLRTTAKKG